MIKSVIAGAVAMAVVSLVQMLLIPLRHLRGQGR